ncbi:hypothetical protein HMPREF0183_0792 [Brevibacterium mcbrellneri ATCC 49030]|uniref:Uncharacterized protein n=1 Tax=Brevibacterium mcbrellneri ATCC 49030 TaxID=585530 RepID=D4YLI2_9MICO|nr:hypothetical protein [Brevibacterium mcbrellneri]EFG47899.1 hypothetical protein HMPREF0183_0792 [Brevibacterium mcbrellneri ATCC 49030]
MRLAGKIIFFVGIIGFVLVLGGAILMGVFSFGKIASTTDSLKRFSATTSIDHDGESNLTVYARSSGAAASVSTDCTVEGPGGEAMYKGGSSGYWSSGSDEKWHYAGSFEAKTAGKYTVTCGGALSDEQLMVGPPVGIGSIFGLTGSILIGVFGGFGFAGLTILGLILWLVGRNKQKKQAGFA